MKAFVYSAWHADHCHCQPERRIGKIDLDRAPGGRGGTAGDGPVLISDTDPQGSTADWFNQRKKAGIETPRYAPLAALRLRERLDALARRRG